MAAARFSVTYAILFALELTVLPLLTGTWNFILGAAVGIYTHMLPGFIMGYYLVSTTTVSEFVAAMERMHTPQTIVIPVSVVFRFFPTVKEEYTAIRDAMKMRGITTLRSPMKMLEYRVVPLMMSVAKIGEELSAAAHTRAWSATEADKYLQNWLWAFGHFLLPAGDTLLGRFLYLLGGRSL